MALFKIIWSDGAEKALKKLDRSIAKRIFEAVGKLEGDPYRSVIRLANSQYFRMRVGDYRVILDIQGDRLRVLVVNVGHRKNIYE